MMNRGPKVYDGLMSQKKDYVALEKKKKESEVKNCSFKPRIDKKSDRMIKSKRQLPPK